MKRVLAIVAIVLSVGVVVGVFIVAGGDGSSEAKGSTTSTTAKDNPAKSGAQAITAAKPQVASAGPVTTSDDDDDDDDNSGKYEAKAAFVGASPSRVQQGKKVKIELRNFAPRSEVMVTVSNGSGTPLVRTVTTDKQGRGRWEITAPAASSVDYVITAAGAGGKSDTTTLRVVPKKS